MLLPDLGRTERERARPGPGAAQVLMKPDDESLVGNDHRHLSASMARSASGARMRTRL